MLFFLFESVADDRGWNDAKHTLLLQSFLEGKAQEACISLSPVDRRDYKIVKDAVLKTYELVPEAYVTLSRRMQCPFLWQHIYFLLKQHEKHRLNKERFPLRVHRHSSRTECYFCSLNQLS